MKKAKNYMVSKKIYFIETENQSFEPIYNKRARTKYVDSNEDGTYYEVGSGQYQENSYNELLRFPFRSNNSNYMSNCKFI